jgi:hypothetical protein
MVRYWLAMGHLKSRGVHKSSVSAPSSVTKRSPCSRGLKFLDQHCVRVKFFEW